jgi:hypothetical protein
MYMRVYLQLFIGIALITGLLLTGCSEDNSSSPTTIVSSGETGHIEGQLVADAGAQTAKLMSVPPQGSYADSAKVYPISGATVELIQNGIVIATTTTDEYGRFRFTDLAPGDYEIRAVSDDGSVAHYHISVNADQTITVYGRVVLGDCLWDQEPGPHWDEMSGGHHWGNGFCGASPGPGYWHNGEEWCEPQGSGPHYGPHHE